jgi:hypothetical protein
MPIASFRSCAATTLLSEQSEHQLRRVTPPGLLASGLAAPVVRHLLVETAGGGRGLAATFFAQGLYIVAAVAVWFQT